MRKPPYTAPVPVPDSLTCTACGGTDFRQIPGASFEMWIAWPGTKGVKNRNAGTDPVGELAVCMTCGRAELFIDDPQAFVEQAQPSIRRVFKRAEKRQK